MSEQSSVISRLEVLSLETLGRGTLSELLGDMVIYRRLAPQDPRLPAFQDAWREMGAPDSRLPRKLEPVYARVVAWLLRRVHELEKPGRRISELLYLGDTAMLDSTAFHNLVRVSGWRGWAFIATERADAPPEIEYRKDGVTLANRWPAITEWLNWLLEDQEAHLDERTAVVVDIDKTALGARGRNAGPIDEARMEGVERTVAQVLGPRFDRDTFQTAYRELNQSRYHSFTADNQDYLAYVCLIIGAGLYELEELKRDIEQGRMVDFAQFIRWADARLCREEDVGFRAIHRAIYACFRAGDPTPFKAFRRQEYLSTVARMNSLPDDAPVEQRLREEICLTGEIMATLRWLRARGVSMLALSDKPDEASVPTPEQAQEGFLPLHRTPTHIVGQPIDDWLPR